MPEDAGSPVRPAPAVAEGPSAGLFGLRLLQLLPVGVVAVLLVPQVLPLSVRGRWFSGLLYYGACLAIAGLLLAECYRFYRRAEARRYRFLTALAYVLLVPAACALYIRTGAVITLDDCTQGSAGGGFRPSSLRYRSPSGPFNVQ
jgi:hypothetical protein